MRNRQARSDRQRWGLLLAGCLKARLVLQGANIPFTAGAEEVLHARGVLVIPDFVANAGGVICAALEYQGASQAAALAAIEESIRANTRAVLDAAAADQVSPRRAALALATDRVRQAMSCRRFSIL
jgi:glutamate dehydrogenase (NAD(P)+)